jgi:hypothetical protein
MQLIFLAPDRDGLPGLPFWAPSLSSILAALSALAGLRTRPLAAPKRAAIH